MAIQQYQSFRHKDAKRGRLGFDTVNERNTVRAGEGFADSLERLLRRPSFKMS
jgi:hypothetical protein